MPRATQPSTTQLAAWRAQVDKELAGAAFDKVLVHSTPEGLALQPVYTDTAFAAGEPGVAPFVRGTTAVPAPFQICMRVDPQAQRRPEALAEDVTGGADALWLDVGDDIALEAALGGALRVIVEANAVGPAAALAWLDGRVPHGHRVVLGLDPIASAARGLTSTQALPDDLVAMGRAVAEAAARWPHAQLVRVSTVPFHVAGADAADELALGLAAGVAYLASLLDAGLDVHSAVRLIGVQTSVGRDTLGELCKLRALRLCWHKVLAAAGAPDVPLPALHAVCSPRTQSQRDPWVNMLRVTTEVFAAALGGAELVTPLAFDEALAGERAPSAQGRRVARNTALVLREESHLGRVGDAAGGAYYLETRTEALARAAWTRFTAIQREGGVVAILTKGALRDRLEIAWAQRAAAIGKRREPVLGVSEFANLGELLPHEVPASAPAPAAPALIPHRDAEGFEAMRARREGTPFEVMLVQLGTPAESRARTEFVRALFATIGVAAIEVSVAEARGGVPNVACLCGSDATYAEHAVSIAAELRESGAMRVAFAGRPGALEAELRSAGVSAFIFMGCDALAILTELTA